MEERKHTRVPLQEIRENSAAGIYLTKEEFRKYGIFAGLLAAILAFSLFLAENTEFSPCQAPFFQIYYKVV